MKDFESLIKSGLEESGKEDAQKLPFSLTVISQQGTLWNDEEVAYIGVQAGSKNAFVNADCYIGYANFFVIYFKRTGEYLLQFNNLVKTWNKKISFPRGFNEEEFKNMIWNFIPYFTNNKYTLV